MPIRPRKRPKVLSGHTHKMVTGCGNAYVTINHDEEGLFEVFFVLGKSGQCGAAQTEAIARMASNALRSGVEPEYLIKQLINIRCPNPVIFGEECLSCADAVAKALRAEVKPDKPSPTK